MARVDPKAERLRVVPLFRACGDEELAVVARVADEVTAHADDRLVRKGGLGHEFFVIVAGTAQVRQEGRPVATLVPGDYFGELALLGEPRRDAEVVAETDMTLLVVGAREFHALLEGAPGVTRAILRGMARRLQQADLART